MGLDLTQALNSNTQLQELCRLPWLAMLGACSAYATFRGPFADFQVRILSLSLCLRNTCNSFTFEHAWKHAFGLQEEKCLFKVSKGHIAYDTSFAKSKVPFASTIATFRGRSFKPAVVVLYKHFHMGFLGDAHIDIDVENEEVMRSPFGISEDNFEKLPQETTTFHLLLCSSGQCQLGSCKPTLA